MKDCRMKVANRAAMRASSTLSPHVSGDIFESLEKEVWDLINDRVPFGIHDVVRGRALVSIPPDLVIIKKQIDLNER